MKRLKKRGLALLFATVVICCASLSASPVSAEVSPSPAPAVASQETLRLGERIYREGILPSGKPLRVSIKGDSAVPGMTFACVSCHLRSGLGAFEEGVYTPPTNGAKLFKPRPVLHRGLELSAQPPLRPAYTDESLIEVLRTGSDPKGRVLSEVMPRYLLDDQDARVLVAYLRSLSAQFSPGVSDTAIRFATVISEDIPPAKSTAMLAAFDAYFDSRNTQVRAVADPRSKGSYRRMAEKMFGSKELATRTTSLSRWILKGPPETWRSQLEAYNGKEPVFALLGGMVSGQWQPVHQFCEENGIPCLFPNTDVPVISDTDWYTLYASKGYYQEGEAAARYLNSTADLPGEHPVVQVVRDSPEAAALAAGFQQTWQGLGHKAPVTVPLPRGKVLDGDFLQRLLASHTTAVLVIWDDAAAIPVLEWLARHDGRPAMVFLSARYLGESVWTLKKSVRDFTYLTYPYSFFPTAGMGKPQLQGDAQKTLRQADIPLKNEVEMITSQTNAVTKLLTSLLIELKGNYYRDNLLDVTGTMMEEQHPLYGQISFATGHRYASRGCYIVQLSPGDTPELVKKSGWEIQ